MIRLNPKRRYLLHYFIVLKTLSDFAGLSFNFSSYNTQCSLNYNKFIENSTILLNFKFLLRKVQIQ